jgi:hypothetical protein
MLFLMPIDIEAVRRLELSPIVSAYGVDDVIRYALSVGVGAGKVGPEEIRYLYEKDLEVLPTFFTVLGYPGPIFRVNDLGVDGSRVVHLEQYIQVHGNVPAAATYVAKNFISAIWDQGDGKAALIEVSRTISLDGAIMPTVTMKQINYCPGGGGFGGEKAPRPKSLAPGELGEESAELDIPESAAFLYRLNGDRNPLHIDLEYARQRGFARPILHGLYLYGLVAQRLIRTQRHTGPRRDFSMFARFCAPSIAGETYVLSWREKAEGHVGSLIRKSEKTVVVEFSIAGMSGA